MASRRHLSLPFQPHCLCHDGDALTNAAAAGRPERPLRDASKIWRENPIELPAHRSTISGIAALERNSYCMRHALFFNFVIEKAMITLWRGVRGDLRCDFCAA